MEKDYPSIARRYLATLIDGLLIILVMIVAAYLFQNNTGPMKTVRIGIILAMFFLYEPLCTSRLHTVGQGIMGVRVRKRVTYARISLPAAYARIVVKIVLGIISFLTIPFTKERRGIHDYAVDSVVIRAE